MRLAFVSNVVYPFVTGGAEKRIYEIGTRLAADGHDITIYGRHFWEGPTPMDYEGMTLRAVAPETDLYEGDRRSITEAIDFALRVLPSLRRQLRCGNHDLVVASVFPYFPVLATKLASLRTDVPLVTTWHEVWDNYWEEYLGRLAPFGKLTERITARVPQCPIAVSDSTATQLAAIGPDRDRIRTLPNGIDYAQIRNTTAAAQGFDVLFAGRLIKDKRVDLLLEAFDRAASTEVTLGIIGDGPERAALETQAERLASCDRITFLGFLEDYEDVLGQMRAAEIFISPSTREGFGLTYAEAMAAGCTVIGADHPDSAAAEVIGSAGFLASPTVSGVTETLKRALDGARPTTDPQTRAQQFSWDRIAREAATIYQAALDGTW